MSCGVLPDQPALVFRLNDNGQGPDLLRQVFLERGWSEFDEETQLDYDWNLWWRTSRFRTSDYELVHPWQRLNHYPKSTLITRKDTLARNLKRMQCVHGSSVFNFSPLSFNLPNDYTKYVKVYESTRQKSDHKPSHWICKPADMSRGRGIFIFRDLSDLLYDCNAVVQLYIDNPFLIGGYKSDLRIYVAVTSFQPLVAYVHEEGIVRFSTEKFDLSSTKNVFAHLTNTSINKHSPGYTEDKDQVGPGCKWTLTRLRQYFLSSNVNDQMLWRRIVNIVILTLLVQAPQVQKVDNCFELYGFDILVDENLKPWLLEVNFSPSLGSDCQADMLAKKPMLHDLMDLLQYTSADSERGGDNFQHHQRFATFSASQGVCAKRALSQRGGVASGDKRSERASRVQGRNSSRIQSGRTSSSLLGGSRENLAGGGLSPLAGHAHFVSQEGDAEKERKRSGVVSASRNGRKEIYDDMQGYHSCDDFTDPAIRADGEAKWMNSPGSGVVNGFVPGDSSQQGLPLSKQHQHSKATVSADSHNSGGSGDSKASKVSTDSGVGTISRSAGSTAQGMHHNMFSSLPEMSSAHRTGSGAKRRDSGCCGEDLSLQLPSLENNAGSSKLSRKSSWMPHKTASEHLTENGRTSGHVSNHRYKASSTKPSNHVERSNPWQQHKENQQPLTHRSVASMSTVSSQSGIKAGSAQLSSPNHRKQPQHRVPPMSRLMQHQHARFSQSQSKASSLSPQASFAHMKKRVGNFFLVFPFNEATHRVATSLDAKVIIRETQNLIKEALNSVSNSRSSADHKRSGSTFGSEGLWAPLKTPAEEM